MDNWWYLEGQRCAEQEFSRRVWCYERRNLFAQLTSAGWKITAGELSLGQMIRNRFTPEREAIDLGIMTLGM